MSEKFDEMGKDFALIQTIAGTIRYEDVGERKCITGVLGVERLVGSSILKTTRFTVDLVSRNLFAGVTYLDVNEDRVIRVSPEPLNARYIDLIDSAFRLSPRFFVQADEDAIKNVVIPRARELLLKERKD